MTCATIGALAGYSKKTVEDLDPNHALRTRNAELEAENTALIYRLAEMELTLQHTRRSMPESDKVDAKADISANQAPPGAGHCRPRAVFGSILVPADANFPADANSPGESTSRQDSSVSELPLEPEGEQECSVGSSKCSQCHQDVSFCRGSNVVKTSHSQWMFKPPPGKFSWAVRIRSEPDSSSSKTKYTLQPFSIFSVSQEVQGCDGVLYLKLMDGRGWVFDRVPQVAIMCIKLPYIDIGVGVGHSFVSSIASDIAIKNCDASSGIEDASTCALESDGGEATSDELQDFNSSVPPVFEGL